MIQGILKYVEGDATQPQGKGHKTILHVTNDEGKWGRGFVLAISKRWKDPEKEYHLWYETGDNFKLGEIQIVPVESDITVVNMIGQKGIYPDKRGTMPIRYGAIRECLIEVRDLLGEVTSIHAPRFGAGLASGVTEGYDLDSWAKIETMLNEEFINYGINVTIYDLPKKK